MVWEVHAPHRAPCDPVHPGPPLHFGTYEGGGSYFLDTPDGWIYLPEGRFPGVVGYWMEVLGRAGPGERVHVKGE